MIKAKHHWFMYPFLIWFTQLKMKFHFRKRLIFGKEINPELPIFVISNHFSWWDGFFISYLNQQRFKKKFHVMMIEENLKKNFFLNKAGVYSVKRNSRDLIESLHYTVELLKNKNNLVILFPQGQFESKYQQPLHFENGVEWIVKKLENEIQLIFIANQIEYFDSSKPIVFIHYEEYNYSGKSMKEIEADYNSFYKKCFEKNLELKDE